MKKIELNAPLRFILIILIWLLTFTVVNIAGAPGTLNNGGAGLIGTLVLYLGALFLAFCYFNDCALKKAAKSSLIVMVILAVAYLIVQCYGYALDAFQINNTTAGKVEVALGGIYMIGKNITLAVCLIFTLVNASNAANASDEECSCKKTKEVETKKEEIKEEKAEEKEAE